MQLIQTVAPLQEPITLAEAKAFMRVLDTDDDILIGSLISAVREHVENVTNRQLESATFELYASNLVTKLPKNPITSILKVEYMDEAGTYVTIGSSDYYFYEHNGIGCIDYIIEPTLQDHKRAMKITFTSGYTNVPEAIKSYMKVKIATLYENREEFVIGASIAEFGNKFVENLLSSYKVRSL